ncbi:phage terminase large subunit [Paenibacillus sp. 1P03SA]|uniref:phage terminase large subunit n=1 Tax=Paenibacillus sp. 1P03SA TaxID=3132294 RepID=UPI00399FF0CD
MNFDILNSTQRQNRISLVGERVRLLEKARKTGALRNNQLEILLNDMEELARLKRIDRGESDVLYFMYEYFSDERNPENDGNLIPLGTRLEDAPRFHGELCDILNVVSTLELNARVGWAAPRGHAKSAYLSNMFPVHQIVYNLRRYILIISETDAMSKKFIEWISQQLKYNEKLRADFGELLSPQKQLNDRDNQEAFLTKNGVLVESASMGKQLRGKRNGAHRPDLVICDDLESSKNTNTPELREKNLHWFNSVVMPIGTKNTAFIYMGTIVHGSGLLPTVLKRGDFKSRIFSAIISPPEREDLWQEFEDLYRNVEDEDRQETALQFYRSNRELMDKGAEVLWPWRWGYAELMLEKINVGSRAFGSEYLNNPLDEESQIFKPDRFTYFDYMDLKDANGRDLSFDYYQFWDIAMGKSNRSDYNAIITLGRERRTGVLYVVDAWAAKCPAHKALEVAVEKIIQYRPKVFGVEVVAAQFDFYRQLREALTRKGIYSVKLKPITPRSKKEDRIEMLEPLVESGILRFMRQQRLLLEQLEQFPTADHDDLPDALAGCVDLCGTTRIRTFKTKPKGL